MPWSQQTLNLIDAAIAEDLGEAGDVTTQILDDADAATNARVIARAEGVIAGLALLPAICAAFSRRLDADLSCEAALGDGEHVSAGAPVAELRGPRSAALAAERALLNFLARMSGVATLTRRYVEAARCGDPDVVVLDTRKTIPGWRELDKYAVRCGGGENHRNGLYDAVLIKDNHLAGLPESDIRAALRCWLDRVADLPRPPAFVEVEVDTLEQLRAVLDVERVDIVMLDNFPIEQLQAAVRLRDEARVPERPLLEASGGVTLDTIATIAATGVDRISVGALTHSAAGLDLSLEIT